MVDERGGEVEHAVALAEVAAQENGTGGDAASTVAVSTASAGKAATSMANSR